MQLLWRRRLDRWYQCGEIDTKMEKLGLAAILFESPIPWLYLFDVINRSHNKVLSTVAKTSPGEVFYLFPAHKSFQAFPQRVLLFLLLEFWQYASITYCSQKPCCGERYSLCGWSWCLRSRCSLYSLSQPITGWIKGTSLRIALEDFIIVQRCSFI